MAKVLIEQVDGRVKFTFTESSHYQYNGTADWPLNSLSMTLDDSSMVTFKNQAGDIVYSILLSDLEKTKAEMEELYADVFVGGSGGGVSREEVAEMIDEAVAPVEDDIETIADDINEKEEVVARALTDLHENKQDKLTAGSGITISGNVISAEGGGGTQLQYYSEDTENNEAKITVEDAGVTGETYFQTAGFNTYTTNEEGDDIYDAGLNVDDRRVSLSYEHLSGDTTLEYGNLSLSTDENGLSVDVGDENDQTTFMVQPSGATINADAIVTESTLASYQPLLTAGSGISINNDVISVTVDPTLDSGSTNPVANSAITQAINTKINGIRTSTFVDAYNKPTGVISQEKGNSATGKAIFGSINGVRILQGSDNYNVNHFNLVETSAITTSMTASSTDSQVPSAKAVYDQLGGLKLVKCTQAEYDALVQGGTVDADTLYVITNVV